MREIALGSLFSGSGSFELAGVLNGITPKWNSEIDKFCLQVEKARFPDVKQLGSVTDINGAEVEPVDIITFGSPCQDMSVAGKQLGIHDGERSNLFFEAIRIIKEMREHDRATGRSDDSLRPRFAVWENVPGAFSSNKGKDFQAVLQAFCSIRGGQDHIVPLPPKNKWLPFGTIVGDGWSIAWRVYNAQFWGVSQRRKRIYLIADFGSERAGEILSECESVFWDFAESGKAWERIATDAQGSAGRSNSAGITQTLNNAPSGSHTVHDVVYPINTMVATRGGKDDMRTCFGVGEPGDPQFTISAAHEHAVCYPIECNGSSESHLEEKIQVYDARGNGNGETVPTITGDHENRITDYTCICVERKNND